MPRTIFGYYPSSGSQENGYVNAGLGSAPSGYGAQYDQLFANNPWRNQEYHVTWLDRLFNGIVRTGYDKWREEMSNNAAQYDAGIYEMMQQNEYNSETERAARMRAAGENPDLLGTGGVADAASHPTDQQDPQVQEAPDGFSILASVSSGVMSLIPSVMSFATQLTQLKGMRIENDARELFFGSAAVDAVTKFFLEGVTDEDYKDAFSSGNWENILQAAEKDSSYLGETLLSSPEARKRFKLVYGMHSRSLIAKMSKYKTFEEFEKARKGLLTQRASQFFSDDDETMEGLIRSFTGPLERYEKRLNEYNERYISGLDPDKASKAKNLGMDVQSAEAQNQLEYEGVIDPTAQAEAENATNRYTAQQNEILSATDELFSSIMLELRGHDNWWSKIAMALVGIARAQVMSGMHVQFGRQSHYEVNGDTGVLTESGRSSFGISF